MFIQALVLIMLLILSAISVLFLIRAKATFTNYMEEFDNRFKRLEVQHEKLHEHIADQHMHLVELTKSLNESLLLNLGNEITKVKNDQFFALLSSEVEENRIRELLPDIDLSNVRKTIIDMRLDNLQEK